MHIRNNIRNFYNTYKKLHNEIESKLEIELINKSYFSSVVLDRLMILFFLQYNNVFPSNYLQEQLKACIEENKSFHKFLYVLVKNINTNHNHRVDQMFEIPYLNMSVLNFPDIYKEYILSNDVYQDIINKFEKYKWVLEDNDEKLTITPSILGNVFEKYINQKEMGAYYTENDTTNYITKNAIILSVINKMKNKEEFIKLLSWNLANQPKRFLNIEKSYQYNYEKDHIDTLINKIEKEIDARNISNLEDFIRINVNLMSLMKFTIETIDCKEMLEDLYISMKSMSILDPTCGTGAFIMTALETMVELYIDVDKRLNNLNEKSSFISSNVKSELDYIIFCIENNLYGVDIMEESIEILKTRLFLRLMKCFDDYENIKIPEITMNFKTGNTLVGEVEKIDPNETNLDEISYIPYSILDNYSGVEDWKRRIKAFHWCNEFKEIMNNGGFDCIIGNPPYIEYSKVRKSQYEIFGYQTINCGNLFAFTLERSYQLLAEGGIMGMIVPISVISTPRMAKVRNLLRQNSNFIFYSNFGDRPGTLFNGVHQKLTIIISEKNSHNDHNTNIYTSKYYHWYQNERDKLFNSLYYQLNHLIDESDNIYYKIGDSQQESILEKLESNKNSLYDILSQDGPYKVYLSMRMTFWAKAFLNEKKSNEFKEFGFKNDVDSKVIMAILNSSLFFMYWESISDCWHITTKELKNFMFDIDKMDMNIRIKLSNLAQQLEDELELTKVYIGSVQTDYEYRHKNCKHIIDEIDYYIGKHYGLSDSELNYLKYYQLKYRMSDEIDVYLEELGG